MKTKYRRLLSLFTTLAMLAIPRTVFATPIQGEDGSGSGQTGAELPSGTTTSADLTRRTWVESTGSASGTGNYREVTDLPEGIYSFENFANPGMFMTWSTSFGGFMILQSFSGSPTEQAADQTDGLFHIIPYGDTGRYVIRLLMDESLTMTFYDYELSSC